MKTFNLFIIASLFALSSITTVSAFRGHPHPHPHPNTVKEKDFKRVSESCRPGDPHGCS